MRWCISAHPSDTQAHENVAIVACISSNSCNGGVRRQGERIRHSMRSLRLGAYEKVSLRTLWARILMLACVPGPGDY